MERLLTVKMTDQSLCWVLLVFLIYGNGSQPSSNKEGGAGRGTVVTGQRKPGEGERQGGSREHVESGKPGGEGGGEHLPGGMTWDVQSSRECRAS